jgi:hypothetical protein
LLAQTDYVHIGQLVQRGTHHSEVVGVCYKLIHFHEGVLGVRQRTLPSAVNQNIDAAELLSIIIQGHHRTPYFSHLEHVS